VKNDPSETWGSSRLSQRKTIVRPSLKRGIVPPLHGNDPHRRVAWQSTLVGENSLSRLAAQPLGRWRRARITARQDGRRWRRASCATDEVIE
jgi:hypothetical protein